MNAPQMKPASPLPPPAKTDYSAIAAMRLTEISEIATRQEKILGDIRRTSRITATILFLVMIFIPTMWIIMKFFG